PGKYDSADAPFRACRRLPAPGLWKTLWENNGSRRLKDGYQASYAKMNQPAASCINRFIFHSLGAWHGEWRLGAPKLSGANWPKVIFPQLLRCTPAHYSW